MASKPKKKPRRTTRKPAKRSKTSKRRTPAKASGQSRLAGVALIALSVALLSVGALVVFAPEAERPWQQAATAALPPSVPEVMAPVIPKARAPQASPTATPTPVAPEVAAVPPRPPAWLNNAVAVKVAPGQPMIAVVIDDMGLDRGRAAKTVALPGPLTLAYLAYANDLAGQTKSARAAGHELLVHVPMEPGSATTDPGPNALLTTLSAEELARRIEWNLSQFSGFVGINNHMGSKATSDRGAMTAVMAALSRRELLFLDSRTSGETVAHDVAQEAGIPALMRDVFIDHDPSPIAVRAALLQVEQVARRQGHAIAIGHPKDATIAALAEWLPDVLARGFAVVPVSAIAVKLAP